MNKELPLPDVARLRVPEDFLWGTAISAHQSEGNNVSSDAWLCENVSPTIYAQPSRDACDSYHRYAEDIAIAADLGFNCHRIGIEWARIEPEPGQFSTAALDHYRRVLEACHARGLKPMVTYNHFTVPRWFAARGGFEVTDAADLFARFAGNTTERLGDLIAYATTFNEANIQRLIALMRQSPGSRPAVDAMLAACARASGSDRFSSLLFAPIDDCEPVLLDANAKATAAMKAGPGDFQIGMTLTMQDIQGVGDDHLAETVVDALYGPWLEAARAADFIGVQTYQRASEGPEIEVRENALRAFERQVGYRRYVFTREIVAKNHIVALTGMVVHARMPTRRVLWSQSFTETDPRDRLFAWLAGHVDRWDDWGELAYSKGASALTQRFLRHFVEFR